MEDYEQLHHDVLSAISELELDDPEYQEKLEKLNAQKQDIEDVMDDELNHAILEDAYYQDLYKEEVNYDDYYDYYDY